jgi:nitroimidazol reductase NimA-like FMN-containing flavoprotein (pyridoxamine 5'-phosphate oxidase superfamily)
MRSTEGWFRSRSVELEQAECLELLESRTVGRVAYCEDGGPVVLPVNYVVHEGAVLLRTAPHTALGRHLQHGPAAFEVDEVDEYTQSGWSVLVRGHASPLDPDDLPAEPGARPVPWAEGARPLFVRISPDTVTGRRLLAG